MSIQAFDIDGPDRIRFGRGRVADVATVIAPDATVAIVTDSGVRAAGCCVPVLAALEDRSVTVIEDVQSNPTVENAQSVANAVGVVDSIVAVGGGSVIDVAKAAAAAATHDGEIRPLLGRDTLRTRPVPVVACPTTAGTGSEVSPAAVMTDPERGHEKRVIADRLLFPQVALVDPDLSEDLPPSLTALTGIDAYSHALGSSISTTDNPFSQAVCLEALSLVEAHLRIAVRDGVAAPAARDGMALAALLAMYGRANGGKAAIHALAHGIQSVIDLPHGMAIAMVMVPILDHAVADAADALAIIGNRVYGAEGAEMECARAAITGIEHLIADLDIVDPDMLPDPTADDSIADRALSSRRHLEAHPTPIDRTAVLELLASIRDYHGV